jgi:phospholipid-binding lipoprotein MlaA
VTRLFWVAAVALLAGCASTAERDARDPWEGFNRGVYNFNDKLDQYVAKPVATGYRKVIPGEIRDRVRNFFGNIGDVFIGVNNFLQGKFEDGVSDWARFAFNTTIGLFGIHDIATDMGYEKHDEDFGQTFGRWGMGSGPYLVLPVLGSSTVRDGIGKGLDFYTDPINETKPFDARWGLVILRLTQTRADLLDASRILEEAALDKYVFQRDAYLQRRRSLIYDGQPPREKEPEDDGADKDKKPAAAEKEGAEDDKDKKPR